MDWKFEFEFETKDGIYGTLKVFYSPEAFAGWDATQVIEHVENEFKAAINLPLTTYKTERVR